MSRLRIYSGGTGRLLLDSEDSEGDERNALVRESYQTGVLLYYDPRGEVRCYVQIYRRVPEQYIAIYEAAPAETNDLLADCKRAIETQVVERNWSIETEEGANQAVFDTIGSAHLSRQETRERIESQLQASLQESPLSLPEIRTHLDSGSTVDFVAPDPTTCVELLEYVRTSFEDEFIVAITRSGRTATVRSADVVIRLDSSVDAAEVSAETRDRIRDARLERIKADAESAVRDLSSTHPDTTAPIAALRATGIESQYDVRLRPTEAPPAWRAPLQTGAASVGVVTTVIAISYAFVTSAAPTLSELLFRPLTLNVPYRPSLQSLPHLSVPTYRLLSWQWILVSGVVLLLAVITASWIRRPLRAVRHLSHRSVAGRQKRSAIESAGNLSEVSESNTIETIANDLSKLRLYERSEEAFRDSLSTVLETVNIDVISQSTHSRARKRGAIAGLGCGLLCGGLAYAIASFAFSSLASVLTARWSTLIHGLILIAGIALIGRVVVFARSGPPWRS